jgi:serine/threonine-protein kinase
MATDPGHNSERQEQLLDAVVCYLEEVDAGRAPDSRAVLARHPDLQDELAAFFADQEKVGGLLAPLRAPAPGALATQEEPGPGQDTTGPYQPQMEDGDRTSGSVVPLPLIPGYEVLGVLGQGGMGIVYKARHVAPDRLAALKMIRSQRLADDVVRARFRTEARAVAQLDHPNLVRVYEYGEAAGQPYFALELVSGGTLAEHCKDCPLSPRAAAALTAQLADAVEYAHRRGILHRDLKPGNILVSGGGVRGESCPTTHPSPLTPHQLKITDFGLAKDLRGGSAELTQPGARVGTPAYFAPEQAEGRSEAIGPETDVFGLGGILYFLFTGRPPFQGTTVGEVVEQARQGQVRLPRQLNGRVPRALERICLKALAADPRQRYPSAAAFGDELRRYLRRPRRIALVAGVLALLLTGVIAGLFRRESGSPAPALTGELIVRLWSADGQRKRAVRVDEPGALPARSGEQVVVEARLNQPAHVYLLWLDGQGGVSPLYPWNDIRIDHDLAAPTPERPPQQVVYSPTTGEFEGIAKGWKLDNHDGLETVLLLARPTPLPADVDLAEVIGQLPPVPLRHPGELAVRGFNQGQPVDSLNLGENRGLETEAAAIDDPLVGLLQRLREHFEVIRAVRFAHAGG